MSAHCGRSGGVLQQPLHEPGGLASDSFMEPHPSGTITAVANNKHWARLFNWRGLSSHSGVTVIILPAEQGKPAADELLTLEEVAQIFKVPPATVRKWRNNRDGPAGFRVGKYVRFRRSQVEKYIADMEARQRELDGQ
jgi:excisionase family DNA binding protein